MISNNDVTQESFYAVTYLTAKIMGKLGGKYKMKMCTILAQKWSSQFF